MKPAAFFVSHLAVLFMRGCALLPLPVLARVGEGLGTLARHLLRRRRQIAATNLRLCFPELSEDERARLLAAHFRVLGRSFLERGLAWWASPARLRRIVHIEGREHLDALFAAKTPVIVLAPHFVGLDLCGTRMALEWDWLSIYAHQKNPVFDRLLYHGRTRFGDTHIFSREEGVRPVLRMLRQGTHGLYYLPDLDHGMKDAVFAPFFGTPAATLTTLSRLARVAHARVLTCTTQILPGGEGYRVHISAPWENFPSDDDAADAARMNAAIEAGIRPHPEQYYWVHRRFKTRPPGEADVYARKGKA